MGMKWIACLSLCVSIAAWTASAAAADWRFVTNSADGDAVHVDLDSLTPANPGQIEAWVRFNYKNPERVDLHGKPFVVTSQVVRNRYDCRRKEVHQLYVSLRDKTGAAKGFDGKKITTPIIPDTIDDAVLQAICMQ